ncbi:hypothetical protein JTE90_022138 [Oedothorax gibbosus]|uniref:Uncharacterized protein n=1 Tax=Oedothorax gibbosus TaxID=931172 RepID=A0AAV6VUI1_9ARAC|nr:hypothetical protein JTE90_022138 [Oedothorax gibbosus]
MKTVTLEARKGNNPVFKLQNTNITERSEEQEGSGSLQSATNDGDVIESEKGVFIDSPEKNETLTGLDCIPDSPYDCIHPDENELIFSEDKRIKIIHKSKPSTKNSLKNTRRKSYVRSGVTNVDSTDSPIKSLKKTGRNAAAKSVGKSVKRTARIKKPFKNTEYEISTGSDVHTSNAKVKKRLNNAEHKINAESDLDSVHVSNSSIKNSSKDANRKSCAGSDAKPIRKPETRIEKALPNTDRNSSYAEADARNIDTSNGIIENASKDAEFKSYAESDLESFDLSDSSLVLSLKKIFGKTSAEPDAKNISDARAEIALKNAERKSCTGSDLESVDKVEASIKNSLRNSDRKSYAKSDIETDADSSSDEETVLQTRIYNEEGKAISNVPVDNSNHASENIESVLNDYDNLNNISFDNSDHSDLKNELNEAFDKSLEKPESRVIPVDGNNSIVKPQVLNCQETDRLEKSFSKKRNPKQKFAAEHSSFELSSLSEAGDADDEIANGVYSNSFNEMKIPKERKTDSEIIKTSSEVHSMCETVESRETSELDEIVQDFFNGTFDVSKYKKNKISPTVSQESYKTIQNGEKTKILTRDKETNLSVSQTPNSVIINTDSEYGAASESPVMSVRRKSLKTKQTPDKDQKNIKKRTPNSLKLPNNSFDDKQKSKKLSAKKSNTNQSLNSKLSSKIRSEDTLFHKGNDLEKSIKNTEFDEKDDFTISFSHERSFFHESIEIPKTENLLKRKSTNGNMRQSGHSRVKQLSNEASASIDTNYGNRETYEQLKNTEKSKPHEIVKTSSAKRPKTWDDLENLYSEETVCQTNSLLRYQDEPLLIKKKSAVIDEFENSFDENTNQYNKRARLQTHNENEYPAFSSTPQNRSGTKNQITLMTPKNTSKMNDDLALVSPNANIIDKIMKNMEKCTQPYLSSSKTKLKTFLSDFEQTNDSNKSPVVAEYSYSIKEIQSTIRVTSGKSKKVRNVIHREVEQQRSLPNKNGQVQKLETAFKSLSSSKDNCEDNSFNKMNLDTPRRTPNKFLNKESGSKVSKPNVLKNILARLDVVEYTNDNGRDSSCADGKQTHHLTHKNKETPDFGSSISTINTFSVEQGHYNLRKRKSKNYYDELESDENDKNLSDDAQYDNMKSDRNAKYNSSNTKHRRDWNDGNTDGTDSSCEIIDILELKQVEKKIDTNRKSFEVEKSKALSTKPENSHKYLDKKKAVIKESSLLPTSSILSDNSDESDSESTIYELNDIKIREINNKSQRNGKRHLLSKEDILEKSSSESDWEIFDYPERNLPQTKINQNKSQLKVADNRNSKSNAKFNAKSNEKNQRSFMSYQNSPESNDAANYDGKKKLVRSVEKNRNTLKIVKEVPSTKNNQNCSIKRSSNNTQDELFVKEQNPQFALELEKSDPNLKITTPQKMSEKSNNHDSYKKYLETIFKSSSKNSTHRNTSSRNLSQKFKENTLSAESNEDEFFSLSSSDSDDREASTPKRILGLGLCGDILSEESGDE